MIYFAHCLEDYGTSREETALMALLAHFGEVLNPSDPVHQAGYVRPEDPRRCMDYWTDLAGTCEQGVAFMRTRDECLGPGVVKEVLEALVLGRPTYEVTRDGLIYDASMSVLSRYPILTIDQARERTRQTDGARE